MVNSIWILRLGKSSEVLGFKTENKSKLKCKIEPLEVSDN